MTQVGQDTLGTRSTMTVGGKQVAYYSLKKASEKIGDISRLPFSMKVLLENLLRFEDGGFTVSTKDIQAIADWQKNPVTGEDHIVNVDLPSGFIWKKGEAGQGSFRASAAGISIGFDKTNWIYYTYDWSNAPA